MVEEKPKPVFKTIEALEKEYGSRNFIELALKETENVENKTTFFSISKGYTNKQGIKRYKNSLGVEASEEMADFFKESFEKLKEKFSELPENKEE